MDSVIVYPEGDGLGIVYPVACGLTVEEIARKDVPAGKPFLIVDRSELPSTSLYREALTADFSEPHGYGIGHEAWLAEQSNTTIEE